jgi:hypothetical protein
LNEGYPHSYGDAEWMLDEIVKSGRVRLVLSGHYHWGVRPFELGGVYFATAPAFAEAPHPFWLYEVGSDGVQLFEHRLEIS